MLRRVSPLASVAMSFSLAFIAMITERGSVSSIDAQVTSGATFDAVSIREVQSVAASVISPHPSGLTAKNATAIDLIRHAFDVIDADVVGNLPGWATTKRFDVVARTSVAPLTRSRLQLMSQAMLQERFRLNASFEQAETAVYALVMERSDGKAGPNLRPSASSCVRDPLVKEPGVLPTRTGTTGSVCDVATITSSGGISGVMGAGVTMGQLARIIHHAA